MKKLASLLSTNFCGVANDNFLKTFASFVLLAWVTETRTRTVLMGVTAASLVLPYILFSPLADRLTAICAKVKIVRYLKLAELPIIALAILGFTVFQSAYVVVISIVLMGLQSSLYSPAKYALVRDIGGEENISSGMGMMEGISFLGVLGGTVAASFLVAGNHLWSYVLMGTLAALGLILSCTIHAEEEKNRELHAISPIRFLRRARRMTKRYPGLPVTITALCIFWAVAAMLQQGLIVYGTEILHLQPSATGTLLVLAAIGIVVGQVTAGFLDKGGRLLGAVPFFGLLAAVLLAILFFGCKTPVSFGTVLGLGAFVLGFFKLPLDAAIQRTVKGPRLNTILAYFNQISFLYMFFASVAYGAIGWFFGPVAFSIVLIVAMIFASLMFLFGSREAITWLGVVMLKGRYKINADKLPPAKTYLLLPNHPALIDPMLVLAAFKDAKLKPLVDGGFFKVPLFGKVLRAFGSVEVPDLREKHTRADVLVAKGLEGVVLNALAEGDNVLLYPSGHIYTENRENIGTRQLAYKVCKSLPKDVAVIGVRTTGLWGSMWSRKGRKHSPNFALTLLKGLIIWPFAALMKKRPITFHVEDLTQAAVTWAAELPRLDFNAKLESWYNLK